VKFKHLFVITYGRSGSTLLSGLLNLVPGALIRGENHGSLNHLYRAVRAVERTLAQPRTVDDDKPIEAWFGASDVKPRAFREAVVQAFVDSVLVPHPDVSLLGFKEISYRLRDFSEEEFSDFLLFLREAFERPCFIFNVRRHDAVARSAWWAGEPGARRELAELDRRLRFAAEQHADISAWVDYDRIVADPLSLRSLYDFLAVPMDEAVVRRVLATPHGYPSEWDQPKAEGRFLKRLKRRLRGRIGRRP
jgi:hypothetical protein